MLLIAVLIGASTLSIVVYMSAQTSAENLSEIQHHIEQGITSNGKVLTENHALALRGLALDNAFLDMQGLVERAVREDAEVAYGIFVSAEGETLAFNKQGSAGNADRVDRVDRVDNADRVDKQAWRTLGIPEASLQVKESTVERTRRFDTEVLEFSAPVMGEENEQLGTVRYGISTRRMVDALVRAKAESKASLLRSVGLIGLFVGLASLLGVLLSRLQAVRITKPVGELTDAAAKLASGDRSVKVDITSGDELQVLGGSFNRMVDELDTSYRQLERMNRTLEARVEERTAQLGAKNRDMRLVLDNVDQGFMTLSPAGIMAQERSKVVDSWFGPCDQPTTFWDYIGRVSPGFGAEFQMAWEQLTDGFLPREVCLMQIPSRLRVGSRTWELRYLALDSSLALDTGLTLDRGEVLEGVLVVASEITERLAKEREEAEQNELMQGFKKLMLDRSGFASFLKDAGQQVQLICTRSLDDDIVTFTHTVHTLKGNCGLMGLSVVARLCHAIEEQTEEKGRPGDAVLAELEARWQAIKEHIASFVGNMDERVIEIPEAEFTSLLVKISRDSFDADALRQMVTWQLEPISRPFERLAQQAKALAKRLGKGDIHVSVQSNGVRLEPETWNPFFSELAHLIRNSVDHGLETASERVVAGKPALGKLVFSACSSAHDLTLEFSDDGRGIDWERIALKAQNFGLPTKTNQDLLDALCHDRVSTRDEVTEISGRGVGMAALRQRVHQMGGTLEVRSKPSLGTTWVIRFPWSPKDVPTARMSRPPPSATASRVHG
jgi:HAMP domain-containing protein/HPt (histidine-containing phosphotransfer) domain-containing protein